MRRGSQGTVPLPPRTRAWAIAALAVFLLGGALCVPPGAQAQGAPNVRIHELQVGQFFTVDVNNPVVVVLKNDGSGANIVRITIVHVDCGGRTGQAVIAEDSPQTVDPGQTVQRAFSWNGRQAADAPGTPAGTPLPGTCQIRASISTIVEETDQAAHQRSQNPFVRSFQPRLQFGAPQNARPGETARQPFTVQNLGNWDDRVQLTITKTTPAWAFSFSTSELDLPEGAAPAEAILRVVVPETAAEGAQGSATIRAVSKHQSTAADTAESNPFTALLRIELRVVIAPSSPGILPGARRSVPFSVENLGNDDETFGLSAEEPAGVLAVSTPAEIKVPPNQSGDAYLVIDAPPGAPAGPFDIVVRAVARREPANQHEGHHTIPVQQVRKVALLSDPSSPSPIVAPPGEEVPVTVVIRNDGNGHDNLQLAEAFSPQGWNLTFDGGPYVLEAGETLPLEVQVRVPDAHAPGDHVVRFVASSVQERHKHADLEVRLLVPALVNAKIEAPHGPQVLPTNGPIQIDIVLRNTGNVADTFQLEAEFDASETSPAGWTVALNRTTADLTAGAKFDVRANVTPPASASERSRALLRIGAAAASNDDFHESASVLIVPPLANLVVGGLPPGPIVVYEGTSLRLEGTIRNEGRRPTGASFDARLTLEEEGTGTLVAATTLRISDLSNTSPANTTAITLNFSTIGRPGRYVARLLADTAGDDGEILELTEADNVADVRVEAHNARIQLAAPPSTKLRPGETLLFHGARAFRVTNLGMFAEWIETVKYSPQNWTRNSTETLLVGAGQSRLVTLNATVPQEPGAPFGVLVVDARIANVSLLLIRNATVIVVNDTNPPTIRGLRASASSIPLGDAVDFSVEVSDAVGVRQVELVLTEERQGVEVHTMRPVASNMETWSVRLHMDRVGSFQYHARAVDNSTSNNRAETGPAATPIVVQPGTAPVTRLVDPEGFAVLREGDAITFHVVDAVPLARIWYTVGVINKSLPVGNPVRVTVEGWPERPTTLALFATNAQGGTSRRDFSFLVDNTAPRVLGIQFAPFDNDTRAFVNVTIEGSDTEKADATLRFPGRLSPLLVLLHAKNATFWQAEVALNPVRPIGVTVTATDAAGNIGRGDADILQPLAIPEGGSPGPGIVAVLAALLLAFAALRGRRRTDPRRYVPLAVVLVLLPILGALPLGLAQTCPAGATIVMEGDRVITSPVRYSCAQLRLSANVTIGNGGRLELVESQMDVTRTRPVEIRVLAGGELLLLREARVQWTGPDNGGFHVTVEAGANLHVRQSKILGIDHLTLRSAPRIEDATIQGRGATTLVVDNASVALQRSTLSGGTIGVSLAGTNAVLTLIQSTITGQTSTALHLGDATEANLEASKAINVPNGALLLGNARLTARSSDLRAQESSLQTLPAGTRHPSVRWEGGTLEPVTRSLSDRTLVERARLVSVRVTWATSSSTSAVGEPVASATVEIRNATGGLQSVQTTGPDGATPLAAVLTETQVGAVQQRHGPFTVLARRDHSGDAMEADIVADHPTHDPLPFALPFDDDREAPQWGSAAPLTASAYSKTGRPVLEWAAATDPTTEETPNRAVSHYYVFRTSSGASLAHVATVATPSHRDDPLSNGRYWYHVQPFDRANNAGANSNVVEVLVDRDPPALSAGFNRTHALVPGNFSSPVVVQAAASDAGSGLDRLRYLVAGQERAEAVTVGAEGVHTIIVLAADKAGNEVRQPVVITYDVSPPRLTARLVPSAPDGRDDWYRTAPRLDVTANDDGPARLYDVRFRWGTGAWALHNPSTPLAGAGIRDLHVIARDGAANEARVSLSVRMDLDAPAVEGTVNAPDGANGWHRSPVQLRCRAEDGASGLERVEFRTQHQDWREIDDPVTLDLSGSSQVQCRATDQAGNVRETAPIPIQVDLDEPIPPTARIVPNPRQTLIDWSDASAHDATSGVWKLRLLRAYAAGGTENLAEYEPTVLRAALPAGQGDNVSYMLEVVDRAGRTARSAPLAPGAAAAPAALLEERPPLVVQELVTLAPTLPTGFAPIEAQFWIDGVLVGAQAEPPFEFELDSRSLADGPHVFESRLISSTGQPYQETRTLEVRNAYSARLGAAGPVYAVAATALGLDLVAAMVGVRRWTLVA